MKYDYIHYRSSSFSCISSNTSPLLSSCLGGGYSTKSNSDAAHVCAWAQGQPAGTPSRKNDSSSLAGNHSCCEFTSTRAVSYQEDSMSQEMTFVQLIQDFFLSYKYHLMTLLLLLQYFIKGNKASFCIPNIILNCRRCLT